MKNKNKQTNIKYRVKEINMKFIQTNILMD